MCCLGEVWKFGIWNLVWTEPSRADSQIDSPPDHKISPDRDHETRFVILSASANPLCDVIGDYATISQSRMPRNLKKTEIVMKTNEVAGCDHASATATATTRD